MPAAGGTAVLLAAWLADVRCFKGFASPSTSLKWLTLPSKSAVSYLLSYEVRGSIATWTRSPTALTAADACVCFAADLVITHALEWPSLTVQWLPVSPASLRISC